MDAYKQVYIVVCIFALLVGATIGYASGPLGASVMIDIAILFYALLLTSAPEIRWVALSLALGTHAATVLSYYSNPIPLPLAVLERGSHGYTLNFDLVQAVVYYELIFEYWRAKRGEKTLKSPAGDAKNTGLTEGPP